MLARLAAQLPSYINDAATARAMASWNSREACIFLSRKEGIFAMFLHMRRRRYTVLAVYGGRRQHDACLMVTELRGGVRSASLGGDINKVFFGGLAAAACAAIVCFTALEIVWRRARAALRWNETPANGNSAAENGYFHALCCEI